MEGRWPAEHQSAKFHTKIFLNTSSCLYMIIGTLEQMIAGYFWWWSGI